MNYLVSLSAAVSLLACQSGPSAVLPESPEPRLDRAVPVADAGTQEPERADSDELRGPVTRALEQCRADAAAAVRRRPAQRAAVPAPQACPSDMKCMPRAKFDALVSNYCELERELGRDTPDFCGGGAGSGPAR